VKGPTTAGPSQAASGSDVLAIAAQYVGVPYLYGGTTPSGFDCSGFVKSVYAKLGVSLPRTADQQLRATVQVPRSQARPGDIVSFVSGGRAYHNGIYAGAGMMYDAPKSGGFVSKRVIWAAVIVFTRVPAR
jgi:cell wall-associated NlpC family hydrolase